MIQNFPNPFDGGPTGHSNISYYEPSKKLERKRQLGDRTLESLSNFFYDVGKRIEEVRKRNYE